MSALICPQCGAGYRAGFAVCHACKVELVDAATFASERASRPRPRDLLSGRPVTTIVHAGLTACREIERALLQAGIPCYLDANAEEGEALAPGALKVGVVVANDDVPRVGALMKARFEDLVAKEGVGSFNSEAIDLTAAEVACPACGHRAPLKDGECADCGLFLGAPE